MVDHEAVLARYIELRSFQTFDPELLDYEQFEKEKAHLSLFSKMSNSAVSVFDMYAGTHVYASENYANLLGYDVEQFLAPGTAYFDERIHPEDRFSLLQMGIQMLEFFLFEKKENSEDYKLVNEFRVLGHDDKYLRVIEQQQVLTLDPKGNFWLALSILDLAPMQDVSKGLESALINFKSGELLSINPTEYQSNSDAAKQLSPREKEVLGLIQKGFLSKEISEKLFISVHTVNTHRQKILQKLGVDNSMEAVQLANRLGLLNY